MMVQGKQTVTDEEITEAMRQAHAPAFTTGELAEQLGMTTEGMRRRLKKLHDEGLVNCKKPGSRTVIWWVKGDQSSAVFST